MSQRRAFCVNATTMGLSTSAPSSPRVPPPELDRQPDNRDQQVQEEEKYEEQSNQQNEKPNESKEQPKEKAEDQPQPPPPPAAAAAAAPQPAQATRSAPVTPAPPRAVHPTISDLPNICRHYAGHSLTGGCESSVGFGNLDSSSSLTLTSTEHYHNQLQKLRTICGEAAITNFELNNLFLNRLKEIDCLDEQCSDGSVGIGY